MNLKIKKVDQNGEGHRDGAKKRERMSDTTVMFYSTVTEQTHTLKEGQKKKKKASDKMMERQKENSCILDFWLR